MAIKGALTNSSAGFQGTIINYNISSGKGSIIPFVCSPTSLSDSYSASYTQTSIAGGSSPQITYTSTGARQVSLSVFVPIDYLPITSGFSYNNTEEYLDAFRALVYPSYTGNGAVIAPSCALSLPNLYLRGCCTSCNIDYKVDRYGRNGEVAAEVSLSFLEILDSSTSASQIAGNVTVIQNSSVSTNTSTTPTSPVIYTSAPGGTTQESNVTITTKGYDYLESTSFAFEEPGVTVIGSNYTYMPIYYGMYCDYPDVHAVQNVLVTWYRNKSLPRQGVSSIAEFHGTENYNVTIGSSTSKRTLYYDTWVRQNTNINSLEVGKAFVMIVVYASVYNSSYCDWKASDYRVRCFKRPK